MHRRSTRSCRITLLRPRWRTNRPSQKLQCCGRTRIISRSARHGSPYCSAVLLVCSLPLHNSNPGTAKTSGRCAAMSKPDWHHGRPVVIHSRAQTAEVMDVFSLVLRRSTHSCSTACLLPPARSTRLWKRSSGCRLPHSVCRSALAPSSTSHCSCWAARDCAPAPIAFETFGDRTGSAPCYSSPIGCDGPA